MTVLFGEWDGRAPGSRRSLDRFGALLGLLDPGPLPPLLTVVGSKGKGTCAAYASACLTAAGYLVVTVTSPSHRELRERVRVCGSAVAGAVLDGLAARIASAAAELPPPGAGYLSPSGLFLLAGVLHAVEIGADALVLEAGRGGRSDEVSLFRPDVVAITPIFGEHLGVLGDTVAEIAADKIGVVGPATRRVLSVPQSPSVAAVLAAHAPVQISAPGSVPADLLPADLLPADLLPAGLGQASAELGCRAAFALLPPAPPEALRAVLSRVTLPGRLSEHRIGDTLLLLDQAVDGTGAAAALAEARRRWGTVDHVLVSLSDDKDLAGVAAALGPLPVTFVELDRSHLRFTRPLPAHWRRVAEPAPLQVGRHVLALGTVSFAAHLLDRLDHPTDRLF